MRVVGRKMNAWEKRMAMYDYHGRVGPPARCGECPYYGEVPFDGKVYKSCGAVAGINTGWHEDWEACGQIGKRLGERVRPEVRMAEEKKGPKRGEQVAGQISFL